MNHIFVKVKNQRKNPFFKLISDHTLYEGVNVNVASCVAYSPDHNLDEETWFKVEGFKNCDFCLDILRKDFDAKDYDDLKKEKFSEIAYLFSIQDGNFYFQKVYPSLFIKRKSITFGEVAKIEQPENRLFIKPLPDAIYLKDSDTLIFRDLAVIASIFKGIDVLFKEATKEEVAKFLAEPFIKLENYGVDDVSKPNRKRIGLAMKTLSDMTVDDRNSLIPYITEYCKNSLTYDEISGKFTISKDDDLKLLVYGIEQRFYTTLISKEKRLANSVQTVA
ncbi:ATP F0F1 synthase synthase [Acinetobacter sp. c3-l95]|uniref:ATP F0F1 synthase synthase n=1 Tax=Acinetobacter sp. c3-l95 TaxID=3342804 RepID=UPI0035B78830